MNWGLFLQIQEEIKVSFTLTSSWSHVPPAQVLLPFQFTLKNSQHEQSRHMGFSWEDEAGLGESLF